jgi:hypothetical protein
MVVSWCVVGSMRQGMQALARPVVIEPAAQGVGGLSGRRERAGAWIRDKHRDDSAGWVEAARAGAMISVDEPWPARCSFV